MSDRTTKRTFTEKVNTSEKHTGGESMELATALEASGSTVLLSVDQAARYLQMSRHWVYKQSAAGTLPCVKLGRATRFRLADLDAWLDAQSKRG